MLYFFFFNDTATTEIYTLSLHDALPIYFESEVKHYRVNYSFPSDRRQDRRIRYIKGRRFLTRVGDNFKRWPDRSEEHTSELQSQSNLVCRLLLEKKKKKS